MEPERRVRRWAQAPSNLYPIFEKCSPTTCQFCRFGFKTQGMSRSSFHPNGGYTHSHETHLQELRWWECGIQKPLWFASARAKAVWKIFPKIHRQGRTNNLVLYYADGTKVHCSDPSLVPTILLLYLIVCVVWILCPHWHRSESHVLAAPSVMAKSDDAHRQNST